MTIDNSVASTILEFEHNLGVFVASRVTRVFDVVRHALELAFNLFRGTRKDSAEDWLEWD